MAVGDSGSMAFLEITDNGVGIPADALPHVFDRFFRADRARSRNTGGTGLGLSIVKAIALAHGGYVNISSKEGTGTQVRFEIPRTSESTIVLETGAPAVTPLEADSTIPDIRH